MTKGENFTDDEKLFIWDKGLQIDGKDPDDYRLDICGAEIYFHSYGKNSEKGWHVDHIKPKSKSGSNDTKNLRPLHWDNNISRQDSFPIWYCAVPDKKKSIHDKV